jgi:ribosomal protein S18 acetylase RimI-like enzyme
MDLIQTDLRTPNLAAGIQANLHAFLKLIGQNQAQPLPGILRWQTELQHPWFNGVLVERAPDPQAVEVIHQLKNLFQAGGVRRWTWWVGQPACPQDWFELLAEAGFRYEHDTPGMAVRLDELADQSLEVPGLTIRTVTDLPELQTWCEVFVAGYGLPLEWAGPFYALMAGIGPDWPGYNYLGYLNGQPAAASSLFLAEGVAGIYNVTTLPQARRKGIGAAMTVTPLVEARRMGYRAGILQSSEAGFSVYRRLGFEQLCEVEVFVWDG